MAHHKKENEYKLIRSSQKAAHNMYIQEPRAAYWLKAQTQPLV